MSESTMDEKLYLDCNLAKLITSMATINVEIRLIFEVKIYMLHIVARIAIK